MKRNIKNIIIATLVIVTMLAFTGCGKKGQDAITPEQSVEKFVEGNSENVAKESEKSECTVELKADGVNIVYEYTYKEQVDSNQKAEEIEAFFAGNEKDILVLTEKLSAECTGADSVVFKYFNKDGSNIYTKTYTIKKNK